MLDRVGSLLDLTILVPIARLNNQLVFSVYIYLIGGVDYYYSILDSLLQPQSICIYLTVAFLFFL
jgi:hypothetical protein